MIKAVLFDLDGTLINTNELILQSFRHALKNGLNIELEDSEIIKFFGEPLKKSMERFGDENVDSLIQIFHEFNERMHDVLAKGFEGVEEALKSIKGSGRKIAVVTSKRKVMALRSLKQINIYELIDVLITPEDTDKHKPDGEPALKACALLGVRPEEALMVGDSIYDIQCGSNAGCSTCAVTYSEFSAEEMAKYKPDYVVDRLTEIENILTQFDSEAS